MRILHPLHPLRALFAAAFLLSYAPAPARAVAVTVFWDDPNFGGYGVSQATALNANALGIPIVPIASIQSNNPATLLDVSHSPDVQSFAIPLPGTTGPATAVSEPWTAINRSSLNGPGDPTPDNLYLVFGRPAAGAIVLNGQSQPVVYDPADVGLNLTSGEAGIANWVLLQAPVAGTGSYVYYPAVSLGTLATGLSSSFQLFYTLKNPQVFSEPINLELGIPSWDLFFASTVVPEPSSGFLLLLGLGVLAAVNRARP